MRSFSIVILITLLTGLSSCEKTEGRGGTGSITGKVMEQVYNDDFSSYLYESPAVDEEIFIMYGDDNILSDREFTGITGEFRFNYLYPGRYYIYYQTRDSTSILDEEIEKLYLVDLDRGEDMDLGNLEMLTALEYDDGAAVIRGTVTEIKYVDESRWPNLVVEYIAPAYEQEIYLTYGNHTYYDDRIRTQHDGSFEFRNLIPGKYLIFLYQEDVTRVVDRLPIKIEVTIEDVDQVVDLGEIKVEKI
jgi:hypothetical protein